MKTIQRTNMLIAAGAVALGLTVATASAASATDTTTIASPSTTLRVRDLSAERTRCEAAIDARLAELTKIDTTLGAATHVSDAHKATQTTNNTAAASGLSTLRTKIAADTDQATLAADCKSIFETYRVFALRAPQTHLVIAGDVESYAVTKLDGVVPKLTDAIAKAQAAGKDVSGANAALADMQAKLADAASQANGLADSVIGYVPADYNANHALLSGARGKARAAATDLKAARVDVKTIEADLKA